LRFSAAGFVGIGLSGAGSSADNRISTNVQAYIDGDGSTGIIADSVSLTAHDTPHIHSIAVGASIAAGVAPLGVGGALSIGVALG